MDDQLSAIASELVSLSERLGDTAVQLLRDAVEEGETKRPSGERSATRARRAVDKAAKILTDEVSLRSEGQHHEQGH